MTSTGRVRATVVLAIGVLTAWACVENISSPPVCPEFCPGGGIVTVESVLTGAVVRDSSFTGYRTANESFVLLASSEAPIDSRPIFETLPILTRIKIDTGTDTTTGPVVIDSVRLAFSWLRRDTTFRNVRLELYRLPIGLDSNSTLAAVIPAFGTPLRVVNLDSLLVARRDSVTGDTILSVDTVRRTVVVSLKFDSAQAPYSLADSGRVAFGVRVTADSNATLVLGSADDGRGPRMTWFNRVDSAGTLVAKAAQPRGLLFDTFVTNYSLPALDSNLTIGGIPATRTLIRFALPRSIRDSAQIIRATMLLIPTGPPPVATRDSVFLLVSHLSADVGAKSPIAADTIGAQSPVFVAGSSDTVHIEMTTLLRFWQFDTTSVNAAFLSLRALDRGLDTLRAAGAEGASFTTLRFFSSRTPAFAPALRLTYVPRVKFGVP